MSDAQQRPVAEKVPAGQSGPVQVSTLPYAQTGYFSKLVCDYLDGNPSLLELAAFTPNLQGLAKALDSLDNQPYDRDLLARELRAQYAEVHKEPAVLENIQALGQGAHAVVTAHQLNLFGGPLYLIYKTVSAIALARRLEREFPTRRIVPVFWLGSEDHDFAEIDHFRLFNRTIRWERAAGGSAGSLDLAGMDQVYAELDTLLGQGAHADSLRDLFRQAYLQTDTLANGQRRLLHALFGQYGLVVLDGDTPAFKRQFAPIMARELSAQFSARATVPALAVLEKEWHVQAPPRPLNLFYRTPGERIRLDWAKEQLHLADTGQTWTVEEALEKLDAHPEQFSPNVILRPLHQQMALPAVAFIGGGAEVAYWLELKPVFEAAGVFMPVVLLRNSALWVDEAGAKRLESLGLSPQALFEEEEALVRRWVHAHEPSDLTLDEERRQAETLYLGLVERVRGVDASLVGKVEADKAALLSAIEKLEQRLVKAAKQRHEVELNQLRKVHARFFPDRGLQERTENFSTIWLRHGSAFIEALLQGFDPLLPEFTVFSEER